MATTAPIRWFLVVLVCCAVGALPEGYSNGGLRAQILDPSESGQLDPDDPEYDPSTDRLARPQDQRRIAPDTFGIYVYRAANPNEEVRFADSLLNGFQRFEPDRSADFDYATLGQIGSAAYPLRYRPLHRTGLQIGLRQFDPYLVDVDRLDLYRLERPFTYLRYMRGSEQDDGMLTARFSRNFADGVNLLLNYDRIFQTGDQDQYPGTAVRNTLVATALSVRPTSSRYSGYFSYSANTFEQLHNGGIADFNRDETGEIDNLQTLVPFLAETRVRHALRQIAATQYLQFGGTRDSITGRERRAFTLRHQLRIDTRDYRLSSVVEETDTNFYLRYPNLLVDVRGQRSLIEHNTISNEIGISTFRRDRSADRETVQRDLIEVSLLHQLHRIGRETGDSTANNLIARGGVGLRPSDRLRLAVTGQVNLVGQIGDYRVAAEGRLDLGRAGQLELAALNQLYAPDLLQQTYLLNGQVIYDRDFAKTLELRLEGAYTLPLIGVKVGLAYSLLNDAIVYDEGGLPRQVGSAASLLQITAERDLLIGEWRFDSRLLLQEGDQDVFRLPRLYGEHSLYYAGKWFGVLNVNVGVDFRYASGFRPNYYNPLLQQFQLQDIQRTDFYAQVDPFFSLRVTRFRFFVKYIQAQTIFTDRLLYLTAEHPYPDAAVRLGASWRLLD